MLKNLENFSLPEVEEEVLKFWKQNNVKELAMRPKDPSHGSGRPAGRFVFFEGPPTANGMPGLHHLLARSFKDIIPRFKAMQGFDVPRKAGWDTHGLPVEIQAEKELGFSGKQDIEKYGIAEFNKKCRELVWRYKKEFEQTTTERLGFWLDTEHPYVTYDNSYIESLWWVISKMDKRKLLYQGHKVVPWCTRCGTALSSHELAQGYKEVEDTSVYVKFKVKKGQKVGNWTTTDKTYILSWTTTPWTLPGNVALAVGEKIDYVAMEITSSLDIQGDKGSTQIRPGIYILAKDTYSNVFPEGSYVADPDKPFLKEFKGRDLLGLAYEPLFKVKPLTTAKSHRVYTADFVTTTDGTGVVHTAVMYGEDDYALGKKVGLPQHHTVLESGHFTKDVKELAGLYAKSKKTEEKIIESLGMRNLLLKTEQYKHEYPHCWRCSTPLLYYARSSWFVAMSQLKKQLAANNQKVQWIPGHIKEGRFGEWLKEVKDWNFSRERYWGTPLPVWRSRDHKQQFVVSSLADIKKYAVTNGNTFYGMRHGEATHNVKERNGGGPESDEFRSELTDKGIKQVEQAAKKLKKKKIHFIVASPYYRTQQTAKILSKALKVKVITDKRLGEIDCGIFNWQSMAAYHAWFKDGKDRWVIAPEKAETFSDVRKRMVEAIRTIDAKHKGKNILIISHGDPIWLLEGVMRGQSNEEFMKRSFYPKMAEPFLIDPPVLPFDDEGRLDVHRPYIDRVVLRHPKTGKELHRVKEVCDVWFDSGAMPFAQSHYPFATKKIDFPADYIAEGIDQTRGWFYTLLAISTALGFGPAYKNVISIGIIHDKNGQKMSKSKGNIVDPLMLMNKYGADALRWYIFNIPDPGEGRNFDEADLGKLTRRFILIVYNSFVFWQSYARRAVDADPYRSPNVLDRWVLARLQQLVGEVTNHLEAYEVGKAAGLIETFTDDLSRWYIRRSRDRFQQAARDGAGEQDAAYASATLHAVLQTVSRILAPFMPFFSDALYRSLGAGHAVSVHLADWPTAPARTLDNELIVDMQMVRDAAAAALALRATAKIKVRQPLQSLTMKNTALRGKEELLKILCDEVNVKEVLFDSKLAAPEGIALDTTITPQLREEGLIRELTRTIAGLRADAKYQMEDQILLAIECSEELGAIMQRHLVTLRKNVNAKTVEFKKTDKVDAQLDTNVDGAPVWIGVRKL